jgi:hypothetical protein
VTLLPEALLEVLLGVVGVIGLVQTVRVGVYKRRLLGDAVQRLGGSTWIVKGIHLPAPDDSRWQKDGRGLLRLGKLRIERTTLDEIVIDETTLWDGSATFSFSRHPYVTAVFRAYQQRQVEPPK